MSSLATALDPGWRPPTRAPSLAAASRRPSGVAPTARTRRLSAALRAGPARSGSSMKLRKEGSRAKKDEPEGWWGQTLNAVRGLPGGLITFAGKAAQTAVAPARAVVDVARGELDVGEGLMAATAPVWTAVGGFADDPWSEEGEGRWQDIARTYAPAVYETAESVRRTGERTTASVAEALGDEWETESYQDALRSGRIVGALLEDVGNVSLAAAAVGGVAGRLATPISRGGRVLTAAERGAAIQAASGMERLALRATSGRGIAGRLEKAGNLPAAERAASFAQKARDVSRLGDPLSLAGRGVGKVGGRAVEQVTGQRPAAWLQAAAESGKAPRLLGRFRPEMQKVRTVQEMVDNWIVQDQSALADAGVQAASARISPHERRLITGIISGEFESARRAVETMAPNQFDDFWSRQVFEPGTVADEMRPTGHEVRDILAAGPDGANLRPEMRDVIGRLQEYLATRTEQSLGTVVDREGRTALYPEGEAPEGVAWTGVRNPEWRLRPSQVFTEDLLHISGEQTGVMPESVAAQRAPLERARDASQRRLHKITGRAERQQRIVDAQEVATRAVPVEPTRLSVFRRGQGVGRAQGLASRLAETMRRKQAELAEAVRDYEARPDAAAADLDRMEQRIDLLTEEVERAARVLEQRGRRMDVAQGFAQATGEMVEGAQRVVERDAAGNPVLRRQLRAGPVVLDPEAGRPSITHEVPPPGPEALALPAEGRLRVTRFREMLKEERTAHRREMLGYIEGLTGGERLAIVRKELRRKGSGEYDWSEQMNPGLRAQMLRDGFLVSDRKTGAGRIMGPDQLALAMEERTGRPYTVDEAVQTYLDAFASYYDPQAAVQRVAERLGMEPTQARAVYEKGAAAIEQMDESLRGEVATYRERFRSLPDEQRAELVELVAMLDADPWGVEVSDYGPVLGEMVGDPDFMESGGPGQRLMNRGADLADITRAVAEPPTLTAVADPAAMGPARHREMGRLAGERAAARNELRRREAELTAGKREEAAAAGAGVRETERAAGRVVRLSDAATTARTRAEQSQLHAEVAETFAQPGEMATRPPTKKQWAQAEGNPAKMAELERRADEAARFGLYANDPQALARATPMEQEAFAATMNRRRTGSFSANQRMAARLGRESEKLTQFRRVEAVERRRFDGLNEQIANLPQELGRTIQDRLVKDVNEPFNKTIGRRVELLDVEGNPRLDADGLPMVEFRPGSVTRRVLSSIKDEADRADLLDLLAEAAEGGEAFGLRLNQPRTYIDVLREHLLPPPLGRRLLDAEGEAYLHGVIDRYEAKRTKLLRQGIDKGFDGALQAAPARFRPALQNARRMVHALLAEADELETVDPFSATKLREMAEEVPTTVVQMLKAGVDPQHLIGGMPPTSVVSGRTRAGGGSLAGKVTSAEKIKKSGLTLRDLTPYLNREASEARARAMNEGRKMLNEQMGKRADELLDLTDANGAPLHPEQMKQAAVDAGLAPLIGDEVLPQTPLVPVSVREAYLQAYGPRGAIWDAIGKGNRAWKSLVLFSPRWQAGNVVGNVIQATVYGGVPPWELARSIVDIVGEARRMGKEAAKAGEPGARGLRQLAREGGMLEGTPAQIGTSGLTLAERTATGQADLQLPQRPERGTEAWRRKEAMYRLHTLSNTNFKINEFVDGITRSATYLSKLRQGLPGGQAVKQSLRALGNYNKMRPWERRYVREALPFYAWLRHQTQAMARLPIDHPGRTAWYLHLGDLFYNDEDAQEMYRLLGANTSLPGGLQMGLASLSPFADSDAASPMPLTLPFTDPLALARSVTPIIKVPAAAAGFDVDRLSQFKRPQSSMRVGDWGEDVSPPLWQSPGALGYIAAGAVPQARAVRDLVMGDVARYRTGEPVPGVKATPRPFPAGVRAGLTAAGVPPVYYTEELEKVTRRREKKERERARG